MRTIRCKSSVEFPPPTVPIAWDWNYSSGEKKEKKVGTGDKGVTVQTTPAFLKKNLPLFQLTSHSSRLK